MRCTTRLAAGQFDPKEEFASFEAAVSEEGAIVTFVGIARPRASNGDAVVGLFLDHHPTMTEASIQAIAVQAVEKFGVGALHVVHRYGHIEPGEAIVFVAAAAIHRRAAFEAAEYAMDRLKTDAVFWKREDGVDDSRWIEPTTTDYVDRARWSE
jgi:molybdopterin synthase catalytic subunit